MRRLSFVLALSLSCATAHAAEQVRASAPFTSISVRGPISVIVDAGKTQTLTVRGSDRFVGGLTSEVVNGELRLGMRDKDRSVGKGEQHVFITVPQLRAFRGEGAGETQLNNIRGDRFDVRYRGAGRLVVNGQVKSLTVRAEGVGEVDTKDLIANEADVRFQGIGDVKVHAKDKLATVVQGMGTLTYYGKPRTIDNSVTGLGSVGAGD